MSQCFFRKLIEGVTKQPQKTVLWFYAIRVILTVNEYSCGLGFELTLTASERTCFHSPFNAQGVMYVLGVCSDECKGLVWYFADAFIQSDLHRRPAVAGK